MKKQAEKPGKLKRTIGIVFIVIIIANMLLFAFGLSSNLIFWGIIILTALVAFFALPKIK